MFISAVLAVLFVASAYSQPKDFFELVMTGTPKEVQAAIDKGADVNSSGKDGMTALMYAAQSNTDPDVISILLTAGADPEAKATTGATALILAASYNQNPDVVDMLLGVTMSVRAKDVEGKTAFDYARGNHALEGSDAYRELKRQNYDLFSIIQDNGTLQDVREAVRNGADPNGLSVSGAQPLLYAAHFSVNPEIITFLLKLGVDINARQASGWTALMTAAAYNENPEVVTTLLRAGADAKIKNSEGKTALDYVQHNKKLEATNALAMLEEALNTR